MTNLSASEIKARIRLEEIIEQDWQPPVKRYSTWWVFFCPFHTNTRSPALGVNLNNGTFECYSCGARGDLFTWRMLRADENFKQALQWYREQLGQPIGSHTTWHLSDRKVPEKTTDAQAPPSESWQIRGRQFIQYAQEQLWKNDAGLQYGLDELFRRRLKPETIMAWRMGFNPSWVSDDPARWGIASCSEDQKVWLAPGLVIPCEIEETLWYLKIRVFGKNGKPVGKHAKSGKYNQPAGGRGALFGAGKFQGKASLLMAESELDAILAWQEGKDLVDIATLGGARKALSSQWIVRLLQYQRIYLAYDQDEAGRNGAQKLAALSQRLVVSPPPEGDLCDFHRLGCGLRTWMAQICEKHGEYETLLVLTEMKCK